MSRQGLIDIEKKLGQGCFGESLENMEVFKKFPELSQPQKSNIEKIVIEFAKRIKDDDKQEFKRFADVLELFILKSQEIQKLKLPNYTNSNRIRNLRISLLSKSKRATQAPGGRKRLVEINVETKRIVNRKVKREIEKVERVQTLSERMLAGGMGK